MNKATLIEKIAALTQINRRHVEEVLDQFVKLTIDELKHNRKVSLVGFGTFEARTRHSRGGVNPQKPNERIQIPEVRVAKFKTGKTLKDALKDR